MNPRQVCVLILGLLILVLMGLFPPVNLVIIFQEVNASGEVLDTQEVTSAFHGYRYYFAPVKGEDGQEYRVAKLILVAQCLFVIVMVRVLIVALRDQKPVLPGGKLFQQP